MLQKLTHLLVEMGPFGLFVMAVLDSSGIPVAGIFDAYLIFMCVQRPGSAWLYAALAIAGSTAGNLVLFFAARKGGEKFLEKYGAGPRVQRFRAWFQRYGLVTVFVPALIPIPMPLKFFVVSAGALGNTPIAFLLVILTARFLRYGGEAGLGVTLGYASKEFLRAHVPHFIAAAVLLFLFLILLIRFNDKQKKTVNY